MEQYVFIFIGLALKELLGMVADVSALTLNVLLVHTGMDIFVNISLNNALIIIYGNRISA